MRHTREMRRFAHTTRNGKPVNSFLMPVTAKDPSSSHYRMHETVTLPAGSDPAAFLFDGFVKSSSVPRGAGLRFIFRHCSVLLCTPHSSTCLPQAGIRAPCPALAGELFTVPSTLATFYEIILFGKAARHVFGKREDSYGDSAIRPSPLAGGR
jgi:hypothetical protein